MSGLAPELVGRVLERLGLAQAPAPDLAGLALVYRSWCRAVPFDNVRKRIHLHEGLPGPLPGDEPAEFLAAWLRDGAGGTCWAGNGALAALLAGLDFASERVLSTMRVAPDLPPNHGSVRVTLDGARYLVDASILFGEPLPLVAGSSTRIADPASGVECRPEGARWVVRWRPFHVPYIDCGLDHFGVGPERFREQHEATRLWSPFNHALSARRVLADGRVVGAAFGQRGEIDRDGTLTVRPFGPGERNAFLVEELGVAPALAQRLPADQPLPPPPRP